MNAHVKTSKPWFREPWPWLLAIMPLTAVIAGSITAWLAVTSNDGLVVDDYYKQGKAINQTKERDRVAQSGYWVRGVDLVAPRWEPTRAHAFEILDLRRRSDCLEATRGVFVEFIVRDVYTLHGNLRNASRAVEIARLEIDRHTTGRRCGRFSLSAT